MSPIEITAPSPEEVQEEQDVESLLKDEDGKPTLEAEVISDFLNFVEWDDIFDAPELSGHIETAEALTLPTEDGEDFVEVEAGTEGAEKIKVQQIAGDILAQVVDEDDLLAMFQYYLEHLPEDTLEDKARKAVFGVLDVGEAGHLFKKKKKKKMGAAYEDGADEAGPILRMMMKRRKTKGAMAYEGEDDLEEDELTEQPFKRGAFRKMHKAGAQDQVARMLLALLGKAAIRRAPGGAGTGYKKGDYKKHPAGYGGGTPKGRKKYRAYLQKFKAKITKAAKKAKKAKRIAGRFAAKAKAKKGAMAKKKKKLVAHAPGSDKPLVASPAQIPGTTVSEGASLAGAVLNVSQSKPITEEREPKADAS